MIQCLAISPIDSTLNLMTHVSLYFFCLGCASCLKLWLKNDALYVFQLLQKICVPLDATADLCLQHYFCVCFTDVQVVINSSVTSEDNRRLHEELPPGKSSNN